MKHEKVLYLTSSFPFGDGEQFLMAEVSALRELCSVIVCPVKPLGLLRHDLPTGPVGGDLLYIPTRSSQQLPLLLLGLATRPIKSVEALVQILRGSPKTIAKNFLAYLRGVALAQHAKSLGVTHVHAHWLTTPATCALVIAKTLDVPFSVTAHRGDIVTNNLVRIKSAESAFLRFISNRGRAMGIGLGALPEKCFVLPMGVNLPREPAPSPLRKPEGATFIFLCPARLLEVKGHPYLLKAASELRKQDIDFKLYLAGDGPDRRALEALTKELELESVVTFFGELKHDELLGKYRAGEVDCVVLPSIETDDGSFEGVPVSLMEAMVHGIPVISTQTGSIPELLPDELEVTVPHKVPGALAKCMVRMAKDSAFRESRIAWGQQAIAGAWSSSSSARLLAVKIAASSNKR
jgi:colanic acid/amylovoran biosynthesis glycosyltransferase